MTYKAIGIAIAPDSASIGAVVVDAAMGQPLRVTVIERVAMGERMTGVVAWFNSRAGDLRAWGLCLPHERDNRQVLVEVGDYALGRPLIDAIGRSDAWRKWEPRVNAVELVGTDLAVPQRDGWRVKVSRRDVVSAARFAMVPGSFEVVGVDRTLARELRAQLDLMAQWREKDNPDATGGELAIACSLAVWNASRTMSAREAGMPREAR